MDIDAIHKGTLTYANYNVGNFYSSGINSPLGAGLIYSGVRAPLYIPDEGVYYTIKSIVYILTHECDVDQENKRPFNDFVVVCPIVAFSKFLETYEKNGYENTLGFAQQVARRQVSRIFYLPQYNNSFPYGGFMYLNNITHAHISAFEDSNARLICSVSAPGLQTIDNFIENHFFRQKSHPLSFGH